MWFECIIVRFRKSIDSAYMIMYSLKMLHAETSLTRVKQRDMPKLLTNLDSFREIKPASLAILAVV